MEGEKDYTICFQAAAEGFRFNGRSNIWKASRDGSGLNCLLCVSCSVRHHLQPFMSDQKALTTRSCLSMPDCSTSSTVTEWARPGPDRGYLLFVRQHHAV
jgi:hypothetical protein